MTTIICNDLIKSTVDQIEIDYDLEGNGKLIASILQDLLKNVLENIISSANTISKSDHDYFQSIIANMVVTNLNNNIINRQPDIILSSKQIDDFAHLCVKELNDLYTCIGGTEDHCELILMFKKIAQSKLFNKKSIYDLFLNNTEFISLEDANNLDENNPMFDDIYNIVHQTLIKLLPNYSQLFANEIIMNDKKNNNNDEIDEINSLKNEITRLQEENDLLEDRIRDIIPIEHQCCICFGYTHKKQVCAPCGHTQYCESCINRIEKCALCNTHITNIIKLYG